MTTRAGRRLKDRRGLTLIEVVVAMAIVTIAGLGIVMMVQKASRLGVAARDQENCARTLDSAFHQLKNYDFYAITPVYSTATSFGLTSKFPYPTTTYTNIETLVKAANFAGYNLAVTYMRRDTTDANNNGYTNDLIAYTPGSGNCDLYDPNVCWQNVNNDNYYGTFISTSTGLRTSEAPDTHIKLVTVNIYGSNTDNFLKQVCTRSDLISLEQYTGISDPDSEATLYIVVDTPTNSGFIHADTTTAQTASLNLVVFSTYSSTVNQYLGDTSASSHYLTLSGESDPTSTINVYVNTYASVTDDTVSDSTGDWSFQSHAATTALKEGYNYIHVQAVKGSYDSPFSDHTIVWDIKPPFASTATPNFSSSPDGKSGFKTYSPYVSVNLADTGYSTTVVSGISSAITQLFESSSTSAQNANFVFASSHEVTFAYGDSTGTVVWVSTNGVVPVLASTNTLGQTITYYMGVQFGDYAGFKSSYTWNFSLSPVMNVSTPVVTNYSPSSWTGSPTEPTIQAQVYDDNSGINPYSISMTLDGSVVCSYANGNLADCYDPNTGYVSYTPSGDLNDTAHTVTVSVQNWAGVNSQFSGWTFGP